MEGKEEDTICGGTLGLFYKMLFLLLTLAVDLQVFYDYSLSRADTFSALS